MHSFWEICYGIFILLLKPPVTFVFYVRILKHATAQIYSRTYLGQNIFIMINLQLPRHLYAACHKKACHKKYSQKKGLLYTNPFFLRVVFYRYQWSDSKAQAKFPVNHRDVFPFVQTRVTYLYLCFGVPQGLYIYKSHWLAQRKQRYLESDLVVIHPLRMEVYERPPTIRLHYLTKLCSDRARSEKTLVEINTHVLGYIYIREKSELAI